MGARRAELCAIRWSDIDLDASGLTIARRLVTGRDAAGHERVYELGGTKANAGHAVALDPATVEQLRAHRRVCAERALACGVSLARDAHVFSIEPDGAEGRKPHSVTRRYGAGHPRPDDMLLMIEVADTTGRWHRTVKRPLYAAAGVAEVWIVDVTGKVIEVAREPDAHGYRSVRQFGIGEAVSPTAFLDLSITVGELFG